MIFNSQDVIFYDKGLSTKLQGQEIRFRALHGGTYQYIFKNVIFLVRSKDENTYYVYEVFVKVCYF